MAQQAISFESLDEIHALFGSRDENLRMIESECQVALVFRGAEVKVTGDEASVSMACRAVGAMLLLYRKGVAPDEQSVRYCLQMAAEGSEQKAADLAGEFLLITDRGKPVRPKTLGQKTYIGAIARHAITLGVGPAGTGKTYLAVAMAVKAYKSHEITRIILTRPAVEAGEKLGFLPGDLQNKVDPYLRPLYDALYDMLGHEGAARLLEKQVIEVAPLAYMRGRTLDDAFIILDEAQNTSREQMKMFLTRMGVGSRMVVTGDVTQIDLPDRSRSGLVDAISVLKHVEGIALVRFTEKDVVRHRLVQDIIRAYDNAARNRPGARDRERK